MPAVECPAAAQAYRKAALARMVRQAVDMRAASSAA